MSRRKLVVGNWKMHGNRAANAQLLAGLKEAGPWNADVAVCVPFPYIAETALALTGTFLVAELLGAWVFNSLALLSDAAR